MLKDMRTIIVLFIGLVMILPAAAPAQEAHNCDFAAVLAQENHILADIVDLQNHPVYPATSIVYDCPEDFFYSFVTCRSSDTTNDDGYGIIYSKDGEITINWSPIGPVTPQQVWHTPLNYYDWQWPYVATDQLTMDTAAAAIMTAANDAVMVMSHARNASPTSGPGNHPFLLDWNGRTYSFMHNGFISDTLKYAMWYDLYYNTGPYPGYWFVKYPSLWNSDPLDWEEFIDSEILFHWIMKNIMEKNGSIFCGLRTALTTTLYNPDGPIVNLYSEFATENHKINFVLSDSESLFVYRNTTLNGAYYNLSYKVYRDEGFIGVKTQITIDNNAQNQIQRFTLVHLTRDQNPLEIVSFPNSIFADLKIDISDDPDPVADHETLIYKIEVVNCGNISASDVVVSDDLPSEIPQPYYSLDGGPWLQWTGSLNLGVLAAGASHSLRVGGEVVFNSTTDRQLKYNAKVQSITFDPDYRNNDETELTTLR